MKIIDIYKRMKDLIRNILREKTSTKSNTSIYEGELDERGRPRIYSDEDVLERACQYKNARDFSKNDEKYYAAALRRRMMLKIRGACGYKPLGNLYSRMLYMYIWEKNINAVYFGLTCDEDRRYNEHTKEEKEILDEMDVAPNCKIGNKSGVQNFIKQHGNFDRYFNISNGYIDAETAAYGEMCLIDHFKTDPEWADKIIVVNRTKGGELGGRCFASARKMAQDVKKILEKQYNTPEELEKGDPKMFAYWAKNSNTQRTLNQGLNKRFFPDAPYSKDEILSVAINYYDENKFKEENEKAYKSARRNKMLDILFPPGFVYVNSDNGKTYNNLKEVSDGLKVDFFDLFNDMKRGQGELDYGITLKPKNEINENVLRKIIKEETEDTEKKGIDLAIKILKKSYPYIVGWEYNYDLETPSSFYIYLNIICDIEKVKEFYNSELKPYYQKRIEELKEDLFPFPTSILKINEELDDQTKFEDYKNMRQELSEIYEMLPEHLVIKDRFGEPKELDPDKFKFV